MTIGYATDGRFKFQNGEIIPKLKIANRFLYFSGFTVGSKVSVDFGDEIITIRKIHV